MTCPTPTINSGEISLSHGEGGRVMRQLIRDRIAAKLSDVQSSSDAASLGTLTGEIAITTDSFVVSPLFFPGGDIGSLAVHGTVNDLAMAGAKPLFLTLSLILEEGLPLGMLDRIIDSIANAAANCDVKIVAGDTKVVPKGAADGIFINTTGVGIHETPHRMSGTSIRSGDVLIVSGPVAQHGLAVLAARESIAFDPPPVSDSAPLQRVASELAHCLGPDLRTMRDATRGGVAAVLHEWAEETGLAMRIEQSRVPMTAESEGVCELLGLDPLMVANEGTFVACVATDRAAEAMEILAAHSLRGAPSVIGEVVQRQMSPVLISRGLGGDQPLDEPIHAMLPRIC
ncbi:hydrogenase expression/formation protein HypE [Stieleria bergensis]